MSLLLSKSDLHRLVRGIPADHPAALRAYELSMRIIAYFLSQEWLARHLKDGARIPPAAAANDTPAVPASHSIELAEMLLNLQFTGGFEHCLARLQADDTAAGETALEAGRLIYACQMGLRYEIDPGLLEMQLADGSRVAVNAQARLAPDAAPSAELVHNQLVAVEPRLPRDRACFLLLQFPTAWGADRLNLLDDGIARFLAGADPRIASVKAYATAHIGPARDLTFAIKEYDHAGSAYARPAGWTVFAQPRTIRWRYLRGL